ncbi:MAG: hypothetical protein ACXAD7_01020 [Candidatus Kariarchaeaceae archaeon]|jgi:glutamyl-tRNA reductase
MLPLGVITWRLGKIKSDIIEPFILDEAKAQEVLTELSAEFTGLYYLSTCQRIILATNTSDELLVNILYLKFVRAIGLNPKYTVKPEFYYSVDALHHLAMVVSSLDSIVIGEVQIQGQFKQAFRAQEQFLDNTLKHVLSQVIRTGKRIRDRSMLKNGKISTISIVHKVLKAELTEAKSIGIVGTGEMGRGILDYLSEKYDQIQVYTRKKSRIGDKISRFTISDFSNIECHDVLILATDAANPIISRSNINSLCNNDKITIVDLGMPRNCDTNVTELSNVSLMSIEDLVLYSKNNLHDTTIESAFNVLDHEIKQILQHYRKSVKSDAVTSLREDLLKTANSKKFEFDSTDPNYSKKFDQFINQLIHVSQRHLENIILENHPSN